MKLLIVDDSNIIRRAIENYLKDFDLEICGSVDNGEEALKKYRKHKPDLVTLDITMPRMDGLSALKEIISLDPEACVLVISALKDRETGIKALKIGAAGFLPKPFTPTQLKEEIQNLLEESKGLSIG